MTINVLSLFDGMSCGQIALNKLGITDYNYYASEIDKFAMQVSKENYPDTIYIGDVTKVEAKNLPKIDLLIGGSPCQGFSFAGKQLNFEDPRSKLFFEFVRLVNECKPKYFLLENVKMKKEYQDVISSYLGVEPIEINSSLVSAQNRKRLYWTNIPGIEQPKDKGILLKDILEYEVDKSFNLNEKQVNKIINSNFIQEKLRIQQGLKSGTLLARDYKDPKCVNIRLSDFTSFSQDNIFCGVDDKVPTLTAGDGGNRPKTYVRKLTPIECERLQTVPDNYTNSVSNSQRYKMLGNGWTVDVIAHIFSFMDLKN